jgi:hypothetical protein
LPAVSYEEEDVQPRRKVTQIDNVNTYLGNPKKYNYRYASGHRVMVMTTWLACMDL